MSRVALLWNNFWGDNSRCRGRIISDQLHIIVFLSWDLFGHLLFWDVVVVQ